MDELVHDTVPQAVVFLLPANFKLLRNTVGMSQQINGGDRISGIINNLDFLVVHPLNDQFEAIVMGKLGQIQRVVDGIECASN